MMATAIRVSVMRSQRRRRGGGAFGFVIAGVGMVDMGSPRMKASRGPAVVARSPDRATCRPQTSLRFMRPAVAFMARSGDRAITHARTSRRRQLHRRQRRCAALFLGPQAKADIDAW